MKYTLVDYLIYIYHKHTTPIYATANNERCCSFLTHTSHSKHIVKRVSPSVALEWPLAWHGNVGFVCCVRWCCEGVNNIDNMLWCSVVFSIHKPIRYIF